MRRHLAYAKYVFRHKWFVFLECLKIGVPIWNAIFHDWTKFRPSEWLPYAHTFYKPDGSKQYNETAEFAQAWMFHQHRNKHHWQRWLKVNGIPLYKTDMLMWDRGVLQRVVERNSGSTNWLELRDVEDVTITADPMPDRLRREMLADWVGAGRALGKPNTWEWYEANKEKMKLHPDTRAWIEAQISEMKRYHDALEKARGMGII